MSFANPNMSMTAHKLDVPRTLDGFENVLIKHLTPTAATEALFGGNGVYAGRCVSRIQNGQAELGVKGQRVGYFLFRGGNQPSTGGYSDPTPIADAPGLTYKDGVDKHILAYAAIEGIELCTTEFDTTQTYYLNDQLKAPAADDAAFSTDAERLAGAGVLTNEDVTYGIDPVVGVVSEVSLKSPHGVSMLQFYGLYRPPIAGLPDGIDEPTWAV